MVLVLVSLASELTAGLSAPIPFIRLSEDESRILVMRNGSWYDEKLEKIELSSGEMLDPFEDFPSCGVYAVESKRLIYPLNWYCLDRELLTDSTLDYLCRINRFGGTWAVKFYSKGTQIRTYTRDELLTGFSSDGFLPFTTWDYFNRWHDNAELQGNTVLLSTSNRQLAGFPLGYSELHQFSLVTGDLQSTKIQNTGFIALLAALAGALASLVMTVVLLRRARQNKLRQNKAA